LIEPTRRLDMQDETRDPARRHRWIGLAVLALPAAVFAVFAVAEGVGLESGWWGHLIQLAVLALLATAAWVRPRIGGPLLIILGVAFAGVVALGGGADPNLGGLAIISAPLVASGVFFTLAGRTTQHAPSRR
jgi:hypothetical protein